MRTYQYIANGEWSLAPNERTGIYIKQFQNEEKRGSRRSVGDLAENSYRMYKTWQEVLHKAGASDAIGESSNAPDSMGIYTPGQFQCMCVIVALFEKESDVKWSHAWLTHVSSQYADEINQMVGMLNQANFAKAHVAIGGRDSSLEPMKLIAGAFNGTPVPDKRPKPLQPKTPYPQPAFKPESIVIYAGGKAGEDFGFGMNKDGLVGEVTGRKPPPTS